MLPANVADEPMRSAQPVLEISAQPYTKRSQYSGKPRFHRRNHAL